MHIDDDKVLNPGKTIISSNKDNLNSEYPRLPEGTEDLSFDKHEKE